MTDRNRKLNDYNEQLRLLDERFENALNRRKETFERSAAEEREDAAAALRRKYVENRFAVKRLPQVAAAQGLSKRNAYIRRNRAANAMPNGQIYAAFVEEYPDVRPEDIPQQVWEWAQQEGSLVSAYRKWEIAELKDELAALEMNQKNRRAAVGPAQSDGEPTGVDPVTLALLGK